jgi:Tfp pilus assembly protein PilF
VDARTGAPIWAEIYERDPSDLLAVQGQLVSTVLDVLGVPMSTEDDRRLAVQPTGSPEAWERYLEGRLQLSLRSRRSVEAAIARLEEALALDPDFALAFAGLAEAYLLLWPLAGVRLAEARLRAREAARAALRADHQLGEAHAALGLLRGIMDHDWYGAEADFRRAVELSPGHATTHHWFGAYLTFVGRRFEEGRAELELARQLDPLSPIILTDLGLALLHQGRGEESRATLRQALDLEPALWRAHHDLGVAEILTGDPEAGAEHLGRAWRLGAYGREPTQADGAPGLGALMDWRAILQRRVADVETGPAHREMRAFEVALLCALLGSHDEAVERLAAVAEEGSWGLVMQYLPAFEPLAGRPGFGRLLREAGLRAPAQGRVDTRGQDIRGAADET